MNIYLPIVSYQNLKRKYNHQHVTSHDENIHSDLHPHNQPKQSQFLIIKTISDKDKQVGTLSPFIIEKHIQGLIGNPKSIKSLRMYQTITRYKCPQNQIISQSRSLCCPSQNSELFKRYHSMSGFERRFRGNNIIGTSRSTCHHSHTHYTKRTTKNNSLR